MGCSNSNKSRQELKKYVKSHFPVSDISFDSRFNLALKRGVASGVFSQPKGASGAVKLSKSPHKEAAKKRKPANVAKKVDQKFDPKFDKKVDKKVAKKVEAKKDVEKKKKAPKKPQRRVSRAKA